MRNSTLTALFVSLLHLAACAGGGGTGERPTDSGVSLGTAQAEGTATANRNFTLTHDPTTGEALVEASLPRTWRALDSMVTRNQLPVAEAEPSAGRMVVRGPMPRLDGARMSRWFDCGRDVTGSVADRATIEVVMGFQLSPTTPEQTRIAWTIQAEARPRYNPDNWIACNPRGALGEYLFDQLADDGTGPSRRPDPHDTDQARPHGLHHRPRSLRGRGADR